MLITVATTLSPPVADPPTNSDIVRVICGAARRLAQEGGALNESLRATLCPPLHLRNHNAIFTNRCSALFRLSAWDDLYAELNRLYKLPHVRPERDARLQTLAVRFGSGWRLTDWTRFPPPLSQPNTCSAAEWFCMPFAKGTAGEINPVLFGNLAKLGSMGPGPDKLADLRMASVQADRDLYLWRADGQARDILAAQDNYDGQTVQQAHAVVDLFERTVSDLVSADLSLLTDALAAGRNAIVLRAHAGVRLIEAKLPEIGAPIWNVVTQKVTKNGANTLLVTPGPELNFRFLKFAKQLKREPQIVVIFPDGAAGTEIRNAALGPAQARIRIGGAALARVAKSTVFFARSVWTGQGFNMVLIKGPDVDPDMPAEVVNDQFVTFYADCLREVIVGAPVDYGSMSFSVCLADHDDPDVQSDEDLN